jgi:hypothetical protein
VLNSVEKRNKRKEMERCGYILGEERDASLDDPLHITRVDAITLNGQSRLDQEGCAQNDTNAACEWTQQHCREVTKPLISCQRREGSCDPSIQLGALVTPNNRCALSTIVGLISWH